MRIVTEAGQRVTDLLELGRYVQDNLHAGCPVPFNDLFCRRRRQG